MESVSTLVQMGSYGGYVWPAYAISVVVLALVLVASLQGARKTEAELEQLQAIRRASRAGERRPAAPPPQGAVVLESKE